MIRPEADPRGLIALYERDREVHPYGLADVHEPFWSRSSWYLRGDAAFGVLDLGWDEAVVYAVSAGHDDETLDLLADAAPALPDRFLVTGPAGTADRLARWFDAAWVLPHVKMHLARPDDLPPDDPRVVELSHGDVAEVIALRAHAEDVSAFFHPELLDTGHYLGIREDGALIAAAGVHVFSEEAGVAAIGNVLTHPAHRRLGLARSVVASLSRRLAAQVPTVGLNVGVANTGARALYEELGFDPLVTYEEADLATRSSVARLTVRGDAS